MPRKRRALLPGKELYKIHFSPVDCCEADPETLVKEIRPLLVLAEKRGWIEKGSLEGHLKKAGNLDVAELWQELGAHNWHKKINPTTPEEGPALAGWQVVFNIQRGIDLWRGFRRPYNGLNQEKTLKGLQEKLTTAIRLSKRIERAMPAEKQETARHILAWTLCWKHPEYIEQVHRENLREHSFEQQQGHRILLITHGLEKGGNWIRMDLESIKRLQKTIEENLPREAKERLEVLRK